MESSAERQPVELVSESAVSQTETLALPALPQDILAIVFSWLSTGDVFGMIRFVCKDYCQAIWRLRTLDFSKVGVRCSDSVAGVKFMQWVLLRFPHLTDLRLSSGAGASAVKTLAQELPKVPGLLRLDLSGCSLRAEFVRPLALALPTWPDGAKAIAAALASGPCALTMLVLSFCRISTEGVHALTAALNISALQDLDLGHNSIMQLAGRWIGAVLPNSKLRRLRLAHNQLTSPGAVGLAEGLPGSCLQVLDLSGNFLTDTGVAALATALQDTGETTNPAPLRELYLSTNEIEAEGAHALATALQSPTCEVHTLDLRKNRVGPAGARALTAALHQASPLITLLLDENALCGLDMSGRGQFDSRGVEALAGALHHNARLTHLSLARNVLCAVSVHRGNLHGQYNPNSLQALAEALRGGTGLQELDLSSNCIGEQGCSVLAKALPLNSRLQVLALADNMVLDGGACVLAEGVLQNKALTHLYLKSNYIGQSGALALKQASALRTQTLQLLMT